MVNTARRSTTTRTVLIAVENPIQRAGLEAILSKAKGVRSVGSVATVDEARADVAELRPDVLLLDIALRRQDETLLHDLSAEYPATAAIVLVDHSEDQCALRYFLSAGGRAGLSDQALEILDDCCLASLRASAKGCLSSDADPDRILKAIHTVASGELAAAPWLTRVLTRGKHNSHGVSPEGEKPVTARELEVITLVAEGLSNKQVASRLGIREQTVKNHLGRISKKLGVTSRLEIGLEAVRRNLRLVSAAGAGELEGDPTA